MTIKSVIGHSWIRTLCVRQPGRASGSVSRPRPGWWWHGSWQPFGPPPWMTRN